MSDDQVRDNRADHRYELPVGAGIAIAQYELDGSTVRFVHTEVPPEAEGKGIASTLVRWALDDVRARGLTVMPYCPYVRTWIARHPAYADLLHPDWHRG